MRTSISTTSGWVRRLSSTPCTPSGASPTTSMSLWAASSAAKPARTMAWSSTMMTRVVT
jgi:hypothetical protein